MILPTRRQILFRLLLIGGALGLWFGTQAMLGARAPLAGDAALGDAVHAWTDRWHAHVVAHPRVADGLLIASSLGIDALTLFLLGWSLLGTSLRPFVGMLVIFALRQMCQLCCALPPPPGMIWHDPGFPSLLVTYGVASDFFFSGHTAIAVYGCLEIGRLGRRWLWLAVPLACFEVLVVLVLRAHWTMDVFTGAMAAVWVWGWIDKPARWLDGKVG